MLPRPLILSFLLATAGSAAAQFSLSDDPPQESPRRSSYGSPRAVVVEPEAQEPATHEPAVHEPAAYEEPAPQAKEVARTPLKLPRQERSAARSLSRPVSAGSMTSLTTVMGSLGIVLGRFVVLVWISRRFAPAGTAALPKEAVELLGRTSLGTNQQMQLVRVGAKLLLVALSPQGARTLTEITSASEVERLTDMCRRQKPDSSTANFRSLVEQIGTERTTSTFVENRTRPAAATASRTRTTARA
jgi:flagellar biogenesis protein FliO